MPQHEEETYAFTESSADVCRQNGILLIGDSIRLGYCRFVKEALADIADVRYTDENCAYTQNTYIKLVSWIGLFQDPNDIRMVLFNNGHWDVAHWNDDTRPLNTVETYTDMLSRIVEKLQALLPKATIVFMTTTPMNPSGISGPHPRDNEIIDRYNQAAVARLADYPINILDLNAFCRSKPAEFFSDYCHFTEAGYRETAAHIAAYIRNNLT